MDRHSLPDPGKNWLADIRQPKPKLPAPVDYGHQSADWPWSVTGEDFANVAGLTAGLSDEMVVSGEWWQEFIGSSHQHISIESALVCPETAPALLAALQTQPPYFLDSNPNFTTLWYFFNVRMSNNFKVNQWIIHPDNEPLGLDCRDPLAKGMPRRLPRIGDPINRMMGWRAALQPQDATIDDTSAIVAQSQIWGSWDKGDSRSEADVDHGHRLMMKGSALKRMLSHSGRHLLLEVIIRRKDRGPDRKLGYFEQFYVRYFLLDADGNFHGLSNPSNLSKHWVRMLCPSTGDPDLASQWMVHHLACMAEGRADMAQWNQTLDSLKKHLHEYRDDRPAGFSWDMFEQALRNP